MKNMNEKLLDTFIREGSSAYQPRFWRPAADVYYCEGMWMIKIELAGVNQGDTQLIADGNNLHVRGLRRGSSMQHIANHKEKFIDLLEIAYNRFERWFEFPFNVESANIHTEYQNGMLLINLKQKEILQ